MKRAYRFLLVSGGIVASATPALAQPESLLSPLNGESAVPFVASHPPFLAAAHEAVERGGWSKAEDALERSETFLLNSGIRSSAGVIASPSKAMSYVIEARADVKERDRVDALLAIDNAMSVPFAPSGPTPPEIVATISPVPAVASTETSRAAVEAPVPMVTKALLPGHWQLVGWQYHWVPPDTTYRSVQSNPYIPGHYEYRGGYWIWVGGHYCTPAS